MNKCILIVSHGHPDLIKGGAEVASYNLFRELKNDGQNVHYLARTNKVTHNGSQFSSINSSRELLVATENAGDAFLHSNLKLNVNTGDIANFLKLLKPDVIHLHHYIGFGVEIFNLIKQVLPNSKIIFTLHEYLAICHNKGLMVKTNERLCYKASPRECSNCFPDMSPADFFLRENYIKNMFLSVDEFIAPSAFLKERYVDWGIAETNCHVIENCIKGEESEYLDRSLKGSKLTRFAFFGQLSSHKGLQVLISAIENLSNKTRRKIKIDIHGANLHEQPKSFQLKLEKSLDSNKDSMIFHGPYEQERMAKLIEKADWVIVPSTWWENSPVVIQEALKMRVPLIVSDIGGMAEKVKHNIEGLHFTARSAIDLAETIDLVANNVDVREHIVSSIPVRVSNSTIIEKHKELYQ